MAVKTKKTKALAKTKPGKNAELYTTLRLIEAHQPCSDGYSDFLLDFGGSPIDGYPELSRKLKGKKAKTGPDTPILLREILELDSGNDYLCGGDRVAWLVSHDCIRPEGMAKQVQEVLERFDGSFRELAVRILLYLDKATREKLLQ